MYFDLENKYFGGDCHRPVNNQFWTSGDDFYRPLSEASEGYIFTGVCHFNSGGGEGGVATPNASGQHLPPPPRTWTWDLVTTPPSPPPPPPRMRPGYNTSLPPSPGAMHRRAVRILLECILVSLMILKPWYFGTFLVLHMLNIF